MKALFTVIIIILMTCTCTPTETSHMTVNTAYQELHRLQFHFSPKEKWMNDPNGMVFYNGEYHLYYQHYPDSTVWGPMHWGHATSKDMIHWEHQPIALYPDTLGYIFSGSAVVDKNNSSGFGTKDNPPLVAIYTYHDAELEKQGSDLYQTQGLAYSLDDGRTWEKYEQNPVLPNPGIRDFRDPKVFWMADKSKWLMALAVKDHISFYSSHDLKKWDHESDFGSNLGAHGGVWECPDLFQLDGKWVLLVSINPGGINGGSATQYFVGNFDGKTFVSQDKSTRWLDYGRDNYAGVTWSDIPKEDGRRLFIGWMSNWDYGNVVPTEKWRSAMTVPRTLYLGTDANGYIVESRVVTELETLHTAERLIKGSSETPISINEEHWSTYDLILNLEGDDLTAQAFKIKLSNDKGDELSLGYQPSSKTFYIDRDSSGLNNFSEKFNGVQSGPLGFEGNKLKLRLLVDVGSLELFINDGRFVMTSLFFPEQPFTNAHFQSESKTISVRGSIFKMKSIW